MPGVSGFSGLLYLRSQYPEIPVVVISATEDRTIMRRCIEVGAAGFIPKSTEMEVMRDAIGAVLAGEIWAPADLDLVLPPDATVVDMMRRLATLTPQQLRVLMMLSQGTAQQADRLRAHGLGGDRQGARLRDSPEARCRKPHSGGHRGFQDRSRPLLAGNRKPVMRSPGVGCGRYVAREPSWRLMHLRGAGCVMNMKSPAGRRS